MNNYKTKIPILTILSAIATLIISGIMFLLSLIVFLVPSVRATLTSEMVEGGLYLIVFSVILAVVSILVFFRKYKISGATIIVFGVIYLFGLWFMAIFLIVFGIIIFKTKEPVGKKILEVLSTSSSSSLTDLSNKIGHNEADIEIAVNDLIEKGEKISFDKSSRTVRKS